MSGCLLKSPPNIKLTNFTYRYKVAVHGIDVSNMGKTDAPVAEFVFFGDIGQELVGLTLIYETFFHIPTNLQKDSALTLYAYNVPTTYSQNTLIYTALFMSLINVIRYK